MVPAGLKLIHFNKTKYLSGTTGMFPNETNSEHLTSKPVCSPSQQCDATLTGHRGTEAKATNQTV